MASSTVVPTCTKGFTSRLVPDRGVHKLGDLVEFSLQPLAQLKLMRDTRGELGGFGRALLDETPQVELEFKGLDIDLRGDSAQRYEIVRDGIELVDDTFGELNR